MKKSTLLSLLIFFISLNCFSQNPLEKINTEEEFEKLNSIENYVVTHQGTTLEGLQNSKSTLLDDITLSSDISSSIDSSDLPGNIPPFWWGFCLSFVGLIVVLILADGDKDSAKKAIVGCLVSGAVGCIAYIGLYVWILGNAALWTSY
jgi:hypothetical protein